MASYKLTEANPLPKTQWPSEKVNETSPEKQLADGGVVLDRTDPEMLRYTKEPRGLARPVFDPPYPLYED